MARSRKTAGPPVPKGVATWAIEKLHPDPRNARTHEPDQVARIAASIRGFGFNNPILVSPAGDVIAGHARLEAARSLKLERVPVLVLDHLTERDRRAYLIVDNRLAELAGWDRGLLQLELEALSLEGLEADALGWSDRELRALIGEEPPDPGDRDQVPEPPGEPRTKPGDLWILGEHRLLCGDSTDPRAWKRLCEGDRDQAQAVFTDPPYGIDYQDAAGTRIRNDRKQGGSLEELLSKAFTAAAAHAREDAAWYVWHASSMRREFDRALAAAGLVELQMIVWAKPNPNLGRAHYQWSHEACYYASREGVQPAWFGGRDQGTVWRFSLSRAEASSTVLGNGVELVAGDARLWVSPKRPGGGVAEDPPGPPHRPGPGAGALRARGGNALGGRARSRSRASNPKTDRARDARAEEQYRTGARRARRVRWIGLHAARGRGARARSAPDGARAALGRRRVRSVEGSDRPRAQTRAIDEGPKG